MVRVKDESKLNTEICKIIVKVGGYSLAWVGYAEQDKEKTVHPVAQFGYEKDSVDTVKSALLMVRGKRLV